MFQLSFSCPENIGSHPKTATGFHCQTCAKNVVDFRNFSADEIGDYLKQNSQTTCGIFNSPQLNRPIRSEVSTLFRFAFGLVFLLGLSSTQLFGQQGQDSLIVADSVQKVPVEQYRFRLMGTVYDQLGNIPFVKVAVYDADQLIAASMTDIDGNYSIDIKCRSLDKPLKVVFNFIGYEREELTCIPKLNADVYLDARLTESAMLGFVGLIIIDPEKQATIPSDPYDFGKTTIRGEDLRNRQR